MCKAELYYKSDSILYVYVFKEGSPYCLRECIIALFRANIQSL